MTVLNGEKMKFFARKLHTNLFEELVLGANMVIEFFFKKRSCFHNRKAGAQTYSKFVLFFV